MASPFAVFRQYQKVLIAVFGVGLMIAFLVEGSLLNILTGGGMGGSRGGARADAPVTFKGGSLSEEQLMRMHRADALANAYIERIGAEARKESQNANVRMFPFADPRSSEARLVNHYLLARKAHEMGLSLSNQDIDELLINMADNALDRDELKKIRQKLLAEDINSSIIITEDQLYAQLRTNLLSQELTAMVRNSTQPLAYEQMGFLPPSSMTLPPARAWEMFRRTARQAKVELLPLEVEQFVDEVKEEPTQKRKDELFEKYKDRVPMPFSSEPGFATPHKISFGYVRVDFQPFLDKAKAEVTEEAIRANYDERAEKGEFTVPVEKKEEKQEKKEGEPEKGEPDDAKPENDKPNEESQPEEKKPADEKPAEEPKEEEPKEDVKANEEGQDNPEDEQQDDSEEELADGEAEAKDEAPQADAAKREEKPAETEPAETKADETKPAETKSDDSQAADAKSDDKKPADNEKQPAEKKPETRVKTYEEMKETIRDQLAQKPASDAQREAVNEIFTALKEFEAKFKEWEIEKKALAEAKGKDKKEPAEQPELMATIGPLLKKYDFKYEQTKSLDSFEIEGTEIGKASVGLPSQQQIPVSELYMYELGLYQALPASEGFLRDTQYVLWKETDQPQRPAERKDVEQELVRAAKMEDAYKLAKAEAETLAAKAREQADESLRKSLGPVDKAAAILEPAPFSWLSTGFAPGGMGMRLQPTEIPEVSYPGEEFMQTVLDLQPGEIGVAADAPHKRVYVIRLISQTPDEEILRQMFLTKGVSDRNVSQQYNSERLQTLDTWLSNVVNEEMQLKWNRQPQQFGQF
jgi:hypothetical protein